MGHFEKPQHASYHAPRFIVEVAWGATAEFAATGGVFFFCYNSTTTTSLNFVCKDNAGCRGITNILEVTTATATIYTYMGG